MTKFTEGTWKTPFKSEKMIEAYILRTDPLNILQNRSPAMPDVNGYSIDNIIKNFGVNPDGYKK